jgi:hypothetical protein
LRRFDRQDTEVRNLPAPLESAAEELESTIERQILGILESAQARATEIEQEAERTAEEIVQDVFAHASRVLDSIELVESALGGMLGGLREELDSMVANQRNERAADMLARGSAPLERQAEQVEGEPDGQGAQTADQSAGTQPEPAEGQPSVQPDEAPELRPAVVIENPPAAKPRRRRLRWLRRR